MSKAFQNFNCIITGGTGELGRTVVAEFLKNGANVITNYRNEKKFHSLQENVLSSEKLLIIHPLAFIL